MKQKDRLQAPAPTRISLLEARCRALVRHPMLPLAVLACLPALAMLYGIAHFAVNAPFLDEFALVGLAADAKNGNLTFDSLLAPHNEHVPLLPRLAALAVLLPTGYDSRALMMISWFLMLAVGVTCLILLRRAAGDDPPWSGWGLAFSGLLFSLCHKATFLDGFQFSMVFPNALAVAALAWMTRETPAGLSRIAGPATLLWLGSASSLNGICAWPVAMLVTAVQRRGRELVRDLAVLAVGSLLSLAFVWPGLTRSVGNVDRGFFYRNPIQSLKFFLAMIGGPFVEGLGLGREELGIVIGAAGFLTVSAMLLWVLVSRKTRSYGLLAVSLYGLVAILATVSGRAAWGPGVAAAQSRWMSFTVLFWIGGLLIAAANTRPASELRHYAIAACGCLLLVLVVNNRALVHDVRATSQGRHKAIEFARFAHLISEQTDGTPLSPYWSLFDMREAHFHKGVKGALSLMSAAHFRPPQAESPLHNGPAPYIGGIFPAPAPIRLRAGETLNLQGWAILPNRNAPGEFIGISINRDDRLFTVFRSPQEDSTWLLRFFKGNYTRAGWRWTVPASALPKGALSINAWVYDPDLNRFIPLYNKDMKEIVVE